MYLSRQLYEEAVHVQFYLTLLDTYVPDHDERAAAFAAVENIPSIQQQGRVLLPLDRLDPASCDRLETRERPPAVPAQPDLLRRLHRGAVLLRRVRLRLLPALARPAARAGRRAPTGCSATRARTWRSRSRSSTTVRARGARAVRRRARARQVRADDRRGGRRARRSSPRTCSAAASPGCRSRDMRAVPGVRAPTSGSRRSGCRSRYGVEEPVRVHGAAGRAGADELLRAPRLGLPGRRRRARSRSTPRSEHHDVLRAAPRDAAPHSARAPVLRPWHFARNTPWRLRCRAALDGQSATARNRTSSSSWATTSAGSTSARTTEASWRAARRTSIASPPRACCSPTTTRRRAARRAAPTSSPASSRSAPASRRSVRPARTIGMPDAGADDRDGAQGAGLRHRPVRQEPPRRSQRVPADRARLRRVLGLPLSPRRDGGPVPSELPARSSRTRSGRATCCTR